MTTTTVTHLRTRLPVAVGLRRGSGSARGRLTESDTLRSFREPNFRIYFAGQVVSQIGTWLQTIAQTLLVLRLERSATALGLLTAVQFSPFLLFGPFAGLLADRLDKRRLLVVTQAAMMGPALVLGVLTITGHVTTTWVFVLAAATGVGNAFDNPARRTILSELVGPADIPNAVSLNSTLMTTAKILAPGLAGVLVASVGLGWCFVINAGTFLAGIIAVRRLDRRTMQPVPPVPRGRRQVREGVRHVLEERELRIAMLLLMVIATTAYNWPVVLPIFAERSMGGNESTYLLLSFVLSVGSLVAAVLIARFRTVTIERVVTLGVAFGLALLAFSVAPTLPVALALALPVGGFGVAYLSSTSSLLQIKVAPEMRGRVIALHAVVFMGSTPIGGPIAGTVTERFGPRAGLLFGALPSLVAASVASLSLRQSNAGPATSGRPAFSASTMRLLRPAWWAGSNQRTR